MKKHNRLFLLTLILFLINVHVCQAARVTGDQIVLYTFKEGSGTTVNDVSGVGAALNLTVASEPAISWIPGGGLSVDAPTIIESGVASTKVIDAVKISNEITVEAWVKPANTTQGGPARIVTISFDPLLRNFTLGQATNTYDIRLRTTGTSLNGIPSVSTPAGTLTANLTHVVYTRDAAGAVKIYIDGNEEANGTIGGDCSNWDDSYNLALANELTNDRAWLGEIHLVAIHDRALTEPEVDQNFAEGASICNVDGDCDDLNVCTDDACVGNVCQYSNNTASCDDGLFCNGNDTCGGGSCSVHAGDPCSGTECNTCQEATDSCFDPVGSACTDDGNVCTDDECDGAGTCGHPNNTAPCDDLLFCNGNDTCSGGSCSVHAGNPCPDDGVYCNGTESCDEVGDQCLSSGDPCPGTECNTCQEGTDTCFDTAGTSCTDDLNVCTDDECDGAGTCGHPNNTAPCDDLLFCNGNDTCSGGSCSVHPGNPCPDDGLYCNGTESCDEVGDQCLSSGDPCPGTECNTCQEATDSCFDPGGTICTDDGNVCTDDECDGAGVCAHPNNTASCDDGLFCTQIDECQGGLCIGRDDPCIDDTTYCDGVEYCLEDVGDFICNSTGDPCDVTLTCDEAYDVCDVSDVTVIVADAYGYSGTIDIELNNFLDFVSEVRLDICDRDQRPWLTISPASCSTTARSSAFTCALTNLGGGCVGVDVTSGVAGFILPGIGAIAQLSYTLDPSTPAGDYADVIPENIDIRDDISLSLAVTPKPGKVGTLECIDAGDCDDLNVCTDDTCVGNVCQYTNNANPCDDGLYCNGTDTCRAGTCSEHTGSPCPETECNTCQEATGSCFDPAGTVCSDDGNVCTDDQCDGAGVCAHLNNSDPCDDGVFCNGSDTCGGGGTCSVHAGTPCPEAECNTCQEATDSCFDIAGASCTDDGNICTDDECDGAGVCEHPDNTASCDDSIACTESDTCSGGACNGSPNNTLCPDGNSCTDDICTVGVGCSNPDNTDPCDDLIACTESDTCSSGACNGTPNNTLCPDGNSCTDDICTVGVGCSNPDNTDPCDDLIACTESDTCSSGACNGTPNNTLCSDSNSCTDDICTVGVGCSNPDNSDPCDDSIYCNGSDTCGGGTCSVHAGDPCSGAECNTCQEATDSCFDIAGTSCTDDGNVCTDDECDGAGVCAHPNNIASCDDGLFCTQIDECQGGLCIRRDDPCIDDGDFCNGVEYCQEEVGSFLCNSTGDPCDLLLICDEAGDVCDVSDVSLIIADAFGYSGTIDIELVNILDPVGELHIDVCAVDQRSWLHIDTGSCDTTGRSSEFSCAISDIGDGCVGVDLTTLSGALDPGTGIIARLNYTIDAIAPLGSFSDLIPENCAILDDTAASLSVTPKPGIVGVVECIVDENCDDSNVCTDDVCASNICQYSNNTGSCNDGLFCNGVDTCSGGGCSVHSGDPCPLGTNCNEGTNSCDSTPSINSTTTTTISECATDVDCDDSNVCTDDACVGNVCQYSNNTDTCDDGFFCNGEEFCVEGICEEGNDPCTQDETCDEEVDLCILSPQILLEPASWFQSRWIPIIMPLKIKGSNTHFASFLVTEVTFNPVNSVWAFPPYVKDDETICIIIFIMPLWVTYPRVGPIGVTVTAGSEVVSGFFDVTLLPFILDERSKKLE